jgi:ankyrin repeat protein
MVEGDDPLQSSPLHDAAQRGCTSVVALLLKHGTDPNQADSRGDTPLHVVCRCAQSYLGLTVPHAEAISQTFQESIIGLLIDAGADPTRSDMAGQPPSALVSRQTPVLRRKLEAAERWWCSSGFSVISKQLVQERSFSTPGAPPCLSLPDVAQVIATFV